MHEKKFKLIIYIVVTLIVSSIPLFFYRQFVVMPKVQKSEAIRQEVFALGEKENLLLSMRLSLINIASLDVRRSSFYSNLQENTDIFERSLETYESLSHTEAEKTLLAALNELKSQLDEQYTAYSSPLSFDPSVILAIPKNSLEYDEFTYNINGSYVLFKDLSSDPAYLTKIEEQDDLSRELSEIVLDLSLDELQTDEGFLKKYGDYINGLYDLKELVYQDYKSVLMTESSVNTILKLTILKDSYTNTLKNLTEEGISIVESIR